MTEKKIPPEAETDTIPPQIGLSQRTLIPWWIINISKENDTSSEGDPERKGKPNRKHQKGDPRPNLINVKEEKIILKTNKTVVDLLEDGPPPGLFGIG